MSRWKLLIDNSLLKHLGIIAGSVVILLLLIFLSLRVYTHHGKSSPLPDFTGLTEAQLQHLIKSKKLRYTIIDSVHMDNAPKGVVLEQSPRPGEHVKKNRRIFFTINAWTVEQVAVPNLTDYSLRNARAMLESFGMSIGDLIYIPSEYTNLVLGQHMNGKPVIPGTLVPRGTRIDLLVGRGLSSETTAVPNLIGMKLYEARRIAQSVYLNIGATIYADSIYTATDSLKAFVWRQNPPSQRGFVLHLGASIDLWLTTDESLIFPQTNETESEDIFESFDNEIL
jgi:eukaryotic-like serine/threonine-protein kinase